MPKGGPIIIENNVAIGPRVSLECMQHGTKVVGNERPGTFSGNIHIKTGAWIGSGVIILADCTIGAGAVVTKDVDPFTTAKFIKNRLTFVN